jgi:hypothetical protein
VPEYSVFYSTNTLKSQLQKLIFDLALLELLLQNCFYFGSSLVEANLRTKIPSPPILEEKPISCSSVCLTVDGCLAGP